MSSTRIPALRKRAPQDPDAEWAALLERPDALAAAVIPFLTSELGDPGRSSSIDLR